MKERRPEGAAFKAVAQSSRRIPAAVALAAVAVLAVALVTKQPAPAPAVPTQSVPPQRPQAEAVTSSVGPTVAATPAPTSWPPARNPTVTPHPTFVAVPVEAAVTQLIPAGSAVVRLTISLPDRWQKASDAMYVRSNGVANAGMSVSAWHLRHVNTFPCRWSSQAFADPSLMRTAEGQAQALSDWWGQDPGKGPYGNSTLAPIASRREATTLLGYPAWYLEVLIPSYLDATECDGGQVILWDAANGDVRYSLGRRELHRLWVVDVDRGPIVIDAASFLPTPSAEATELQAIVDSIVIEP